MTESNGSDNPRPSSAERAAKDVFSSEKREDIWALLIAAGLFLASIVAPAQVHSLFSSVLILF